MPVSVYRPSQMKTLPRLISFRSKRTSRGVDRLFPCIPHHHGDIQDLFYSQQDQTPRHTRKCCLPPSNPAWKWRGHVSFHILQRILLYCTSTFPEVTLRQWSCQAGTLQNIPHHFKGAGMTFCYVCRSWMLRSVTIGSSKPPPDPPLLISNSQLLPLPSAPRAPSQGLPLPCVPAILFLRTPLLLQMVPHQMNWEQNLTRWVKSITVPYFRIIFVQKENILVNQYLERALTELNMHGKK